MDVGILDPELVQPRHEEFTKVSAYYCFLLSPVLLTVVPLLKFLLVPLTIELLIQSWMNSVILLFGIQNLLLKIRETM